MVRYGPCDGHQVGALALVEFIQIRLVLEEIGVETLLYELYVRLDVIVEDFDLQIDAIFGQHRFDHFENFRVGHGRGADGQGFIGVGAQGEQGGNYCEKLFHASTPLKKDPLGRESLGYLGLPVGEMRHQLVADGLQDLHQDQ